VAAPQPQAQAQESTAGHIAGGSTNEIHALSRTETQVAAHKSHKHYIVLLCILLYWLLLLWGFPQGFFFTLQKSRAIVGA